MTSVRTSRGTVIQVVKYDDYQQTTSETTIKRQTSDKQTTTNKNEKKEKEEYSPLIQSWIDYRKQIKKPLTDLSLKQLQKKIDSEGEAKAEYIINLSIENGWQGLFWDKYIAGIFKFRLFFCINRR